MDLLGLFGILIFTLTLLWQVKKLEEVNEGLTERLRGAESDRDKYRYLIELERKG